MKKFKQPLLVAIVGGSGSGKSWLALKLEAALAPNARRLSLDDFYRDRSHLSPGQRARLNFDKPSAIDWPAFERVLRSCVQWHNTEVPRYDFKTHCRLPRMRALKPKAIMLVEGLWLLRSPRIRKFFDFAVFLESSVQLRLGRRLARDVTGRGRSPESVREQFRNSVEPMHRRFVQPQIQRADIVFKSGWNMQKIDELAVLLHQKLAKRKGLP